MKFLEENDDKLGVVNVKQDDDQWIFSQHFIAYSQSRTLCVKILGEIAMRHQSYHGIQVTLDAYLEDMSILQPSSLNLRMIVPLLMIQLGKDDEAYCFIKHWVKITITGK